VTISVSSVLVSARGRIVVLNLLDLSSSTQQVLRKPWCPACWDRPEGPVDPVQGTPHVAG
jgi:hypothetical protein